MESFTRAQQLPSLESLQGSPTCSVWCAPPQGVTDSCPRCAFGARSSVRGSRPDAPLCVPAVTLQWWCTKSWFCWLRSWVAATLSWRVFLENRSGSARGHAVAAAGVYPSFPCQGIHTPTVRILFFYSHFSFPQTVPCFSVHRRMLFWLKIGSLQYAILKTALSVFSIVLWTNGNFDLSNVRKGFSSLK